MGNAAVSAPAETKKKTPKKPPFWKANRMSEAERTLGVKRKSFGERLALDLRTNWLVYLLAMPALIYFFVYCYKPIGGLVIAFKDYKITGSIWDAEWVGFEHFIDFFESYYFGRLLRNTLTISLSTLVFGFPVPIIFALLLNEMRNLHFKKLAQTITYIPHFISLVVICGMILDFTRIDGLINTIIKLFGGEPIAFLSKAEWFVPVYVISDIWQSFGWNSIVFMAALTAVDPALYEAAKLDGASRLQQIWHISLPSILPTVVTMLVLRMGAVMNVGYEKITNLYNAGTYRTADVISTYVYRMGILGADYSSSTAIGLFNSVVSVILVVLANKISRKLTETSLW